MYLRVASHVISKELIQKIELELKKRLDRVTIPGFKGRSIWQVGRFFARSLYDEDLMLRASSLAYNFFLSLFPALIFLFTLLPFIPIEGFQDDLLAQLKYLLPEDAYTTILSTVEDILKGGSLSLLSFGFLFAIYFSSNAFNSMMAAFNKYIQEKDKRPWYSSRWRSVWLTFLISLIAVCVVLVITYASLALDWIQGQTGFNANAYSTLLQIMQYLFLGLLIYLSISSLYYFGSSKVSKWHFFSPGSTLATILAIITTTGFTFYVNNFDSYNKLYGSIGTVIVLMVLIYFNCLVLLIGFELNSSIDRARSVSEPLERRKK